MSLSWLLSKLSIGALKQYNAIQSVRRVSMNSALYIQPTSCLYKEPLKRRKKMDPAFYKAKEEKKKRKIEKEIRRLSKYVQTLKPVEELQLPLQILDQKEQRMRTGLVISSEEEEQRILLLKDWSRLRLREQLADFENLRRINHSQLLALKELRAESEELYQAAIQVDESLLSRPVKGPTSTPPIKDYDSPDGDYVNTSFKWE